MINRKITSIKPCVALAGYNSANYISNSAFKTDTSNSLINRIVNNAKQISYECDVLVRNQAVPLNKGLTGVLFQLTNVVTGPNVSVYQNALSLGGRCNILTDFATGGVLPGHTIPIGKWFKIKTLVDYENRYYEVNVDDVIYRYSPESSAVFNQLPNSESDLSTFVAPRSGSANGTSNAYRSGEGWILYIGGVTTLTGSISYANFKLTTDLGTATFPLTESGTQFFSIEDPSYYLTLTGGRG